MRIISNDFKGIYLHECEKNSLEEDIINIFLDKIADLPIAQNVLITNKETTSEEIQSFFHRAILCNFNTLFVVEINDSFSEYQQSIMNSYIDNLLTYKNAFYNDETNENVDKEKTNQYLDSCIVFVYEHKNKNIINQIVKFTPHQKEEKEEKRKFLKRINTSQKLDILPSREGTKKFKDTELKNILVMTSDICGLGKSEKIKKMINDSKKKYFHFPLGGILTKSIIFDKLDRLLNEINNEINNNNRKYQDIAIHLDLTESKEISIINEFFFSFLITRFYTNNENILYIAKDINIYIEIPNCFEDYLSKFSILNIFNKDNITIETMPSFNYSQEIINCFDRMLGIKSNDEIKEFINKYIGVSIYSFHQINIFIKLFISQYLNYNSEKKLKFKVGEKDVTEKCIREFAESTKNFTNGGFSRLLTEQKYKIDEKNKKKDFLDILSDTYENDLNEMKIPSPLIFINKEKETYEELYVPSINSTKNQTSKDFLKKFIETLKLPSTVDSLLPIIEEKNNNYVITNDNFNKMILLVYRIIANVPVIIMGDTGCGKTTLITKLNQILNGGESTLKKINIHPGINDELLCEKMREADEEAEKLDKELWVFFDEMNTCLSLSLLTEIFINRNCNGKKINDKIRLIGACNPYRKRKGNKEKCGLSISDDNDNELVYLVQPLPQSLLYYVFSFGSISKIDEKQYIYSIIEKLFTQEEKFLHEMTTEAISQCHIYLRKKYDPSVVSLREIARFFKCIEFFIKYFTIKNKYENRQNNEKNNKLRSIICSIYLCYYIRLTDDEIRSNFEAELSPILLKLVNYENIIDEKGDDLIDKIKNEELKNEIYTRPEEIIKKFSDFLRIEQDYIIDQIELDKGIGKNALLKENVFLLFLSVITNIPLIIIGKPGTGKSLSAQLLNKSMRGKYSKNKFFQQFQRIYQIYFQGSESTQPEDVQKLFKEAGRKLQSFKKNNEKEEDLPIIMVLFDELGLAERSESNPLKILHENLEYTGKEEGVSFVGISNYSLDAAKINRALVLSVPDLDQKVDDLIETSKNIVESISDKLIKEPIFGVISKTYFEYKRILQNIKDLVVYSKYIDINKNNEEEKGPLTHQDDKNINENSNASPSATDNDGLGTNTDHNKDNKEEQTKQSKSKEREKKPFEEIKSSKEFINLLKKENKIRKDFHGNRDFYNLIRGIANKLKSGDATDYEKVSIIIQYIERNFGGIDYEIEIDLKLKLEDKKKEIELIKDILKDYELYDEDKKKIKLNSVFLFKQLYNKECGKLDPNSNLKIDKKIINEYNLNNCINDNIKDVNSRYLLLEIKTSLTTLIYQNIKLQNPFKSHIVLYDGSPFIDDNNKEYRFEIINKIQDDAKENKLIIIENLNQIHPFLFDLYNMNYIIKDDKKFVRICLENFNEQLTEVNKEFRVIILVDKNFVQNCDLAFLNRLEKLNLSFEKLLDKDSKRISTNLINEIKLKKTIDKININYSLKDLLINCGIEEIQALIYYFSKESKKGDNDDNEDQKENKIDEGILKENVINKIYKILPQDIICILDDKNIIKQKYYKSKNIFYNYNDYKNYLSEEENSKKYKISIIYTFSSIANIVDGLNKGMSFMVSEIRSEHGLKTSIDEIKSKNENNKLKKEYIICIDFEQSNSIKMKFISNFILNSFKDDNYNYILIIHINRNFNEKNHERLYSLPDIEPSINQLFIDNLNGNNEIKLNELLTIDIKKILEDKKEQLKLKEEFDKTLINTLTKELNDRHTDDDIIYEYINDIHNYINEEDEIRDKIIETAYKLIDSKEEEVNCKDIIKKIYNNSYINKYTVDISSFLIDYIKENIFNSYINKVLLKLEDNNILTTMTELRKNNFKEISKNSVEKLIKNYLDEIAKQKLETKPEPKFLFNYNIPGLYKFYEDISDYISKNIVFFYFNNEKKLREALKVDDEKIRQFYETEDYLLNNINKYIGNNKFVNDTLKTIKPDLIFKEYTTYYLQKHKNKMEVYRLDDIYHKIIELLLKLRFKEELNDVNGLLMKIMWIESNVNYILQIFKILDCATPIFNNSNKLYNKIDDIINKEENKIKYITNENKNPEHTKKVNECYYILLASICYSITSDEIELTESISETKNNEIEIEITHYNYILIEINKILQNLNDDLYIYLNEMYIIDELIKIIELFTKKNSITKIKEIKDLLRENALVIQKFTNDKLSFELIQNFEEIYSLIIKDEVIDKNDIFFYDKLRYILFKEIKKIPDINYRYKILEKILESNEMIKKSKEIFQILLKNYVKKEYKENRNNILSGDNDIIKLLDKKINDNFVLDETLLYFFEKNALNYLEKVINSKKEIIKDKKKFQKIIKLEDEPLEIFKMCYEVLNIYIFDPDKLSTKLKEVGKLFCLGYVKTYIYTFIKSFDDKDSKFEDPNPIINFIKGENSLFKMISIYIYKIFYYNYGIDVFINEDMIKKYKLNEYKDFSKYKEEKELKKIYKIDYQIKTLIDDNFYNSYKVLENYKNNDFINKIKPNEFDLEDFGIDNFYIASYNLMLLSNLQMGYKNNNFYKNICEPLFKENNKNNSLLFKAIQLFYDSEKYKDIKNSFRIDSNNIKSLLFGYRYCLNELSSKTQKGIYYSLYGSEYEKCLKEKYFPGNDTKPNEVYSSIINHFKTNPKEGCYVCLCQEGGYYHLVKSGFPGNLEYNKRCPKCQKNIGTIKGNNKNEKIIVKRNDYYRIFKDENEIEMIKGSSKSKKLKDINYMTIAQYKEKYVIKDFKNEKGIFITIDTNYFKNDQKIVRNLSQISFRILNYILYSHLFFARIITNNKKEFDKYLPKAKGISWVETLYERWNLLKNELLKENIDSIEKFMSYIFSDLFPILNKEKRTDDYDTFIKFEDKLNSKIQQLIKKYKEDSNKNILIKNKNDEDKTSFVYLLKEIYTSTEYKKEEFPFYEYFYYTDYLNEKKIIEKLALMDEKKFPVLKKYLESKNNQTDKNIYSLNNLNLFNSVLNLINDKYSNKISREYAENKKLRDEDIYFNNKDLIDKFIIFYNDLKTKEKTILKIKDTNCEKLTVDHPLCNFLLDDNNQFSIAYKNIYKKFANEQNEKLEYLIDNKIEKGLFDQNYKNKINIQQINEKEIFTLCLPEKKSFINILFDSSYRKILDSETRSYESYKEYEIDFELIEENMTELLLKNKKLLNDEVTEFIYNSEVFSNQVSDLISMFKKNYNHKIIALHDKLIIYKFYKDNKNNSYLIKRIINDFIELIKYLNDRRKGNNDKDSKKENDFNITEDTKIYEIINNLKDKFSNNFIKIFEKQDSLTVEKAFEIFSYYLKLIFEVVMDELKDYQNDLNKELVSNHFKNEKSHLINKKDFATAIRLFTTLVLFLEGDKENKIKSNRNNVVNYLRASDLWSNDIYDHENFNGNLNELKLINAQISQIISLYEALGKDIEDNFFNDVKGEIEKEEEQVKINIMENINADGGDDYDEEEDPFAANNEEDQEGDRD